MKLAATDVSRSALWTKVARKLMDEVQKEFFKAGFDCAKELAETLAAYTFSKAKDKAGELAVNLNIGFSDYLSSHIERFSSIKTLVNRHIPTPFLRVYVDSRIMIGKVTKDEKDIFDLSLHERRMIISGRAGCGKSMLMRRHFLRILQDGRGYVPIFVALREVDSENVTLYQFLLKSLREAATALTEHQFQYGLSTGKFMLLLDGLDEVSPAARGIISKQILDMSHSYRKLIILCTSRPDESFIAWNEFSVGYIRPFEIDQVEKLIKQSPFEDEETKSNFLSKVSDGLFKTHESFLSNPLLCMMMLLTYDEQKEIPGKMHSFYARAYDVLYGTHDRSKGHGFKRKFYTDLEPSDFRDVFCTFCTMLYIGDRITFSIDEGRFFAKKALKMHNKDIDAGKLIEDLIESVSILTKDGLYISFIHRSFQEYFVAVFANERYSNNIYGILEFSLAKQDQVTKLLFDINRDAFEKKYFRKKLSSVIGEIEKSKPSLHPGNCFAFFYLVLSVEDGSDERGEMSLLVSDGKRQAPLAPFLALIQRVYGDLEYWPSEKFDWEGWGKKHASKSEDGLGVDFRAPSNEILLNTPVSKMLQRLLALLKGMRKEMDKNEDLRDDLFSDLQFKT